MLGKSRKKVFLQEINATLATIYLIPSIGVCFFKEMGSGLQTCIQVSDYLIDSFPYMAMISLL